MYLKAGSSHNMCIGFESGGEKEKFGGRGRTLLVGARKE
jgi:hypothetical protein